MISRIRLKQLMPPNKALLDRILSEARRQFGGKWMARTISINHNDPLSHVGRWELLRLPEGVA